MHINHEIIKKKCEILRLAKQGISQREISRLTLVPRSTVQRTLKKDANNIAFLRLKGSGRRNSRV